MVKIVKSPAAAVLFGAATTSPREDVLTTLPSMAVNERVIPGPVVGERFIDEQGVHWLVQAVTRSHQLNGFYIVRMAFGEDERCEKDVWVLARREYEALWRERNLKAN